MRIDLDGHTGLISGDTDYPMENTNSIGFFLEEFPDGTKISFYYGPAASEQEDPGGLVLVSQDPDDYVPGAKEQFEKDARAMGIAGEFTYRLLFEKPASAKAEEERSAIRSSGKNGS